MKITLFAVGKIKESWAKQACEEYIQRLQHRCKLAIVEVRDVEALAKSLASRQLVWLLDERGQSVSSVQLSQRIEQLQNAGIGDLAVVLGGPDGVPESLRKTVHFVWSLSSLTFPYQIARILVLEQLYRAHSILHNEPYHRA